MSLKNSFFFNFLDDNESFNKSKKIDQSFYTSQKLGKMVSCPPPSSTAGKNHKKYKWKKIYIKSLTFLKNVELSLQNKSFDFYLKRFFFQFQ